MSRRSLALAILFSFLLRGMPAMAATVPDHLSYEGRILDNARNPVTSTVVLRFSLWKSEDWTADDTSGGAINTDAVNYGAWYEVQTITPSSNGIIQVQLGAGTALPTLDFSKHKYLQVETKSVGQPDTAYVLLDPTGDSGIDTVDRKAIASVAYAKNAESVGNRTIGTASGNILLLGPDGKIRASQVGNGTTAQSFMINTDNAAGDTTLTFGGSLGAKILQYSTENQRFEFNDSVSITGNLTVSGLINGVSINTDMMEYDSLQVLTPAYDKTSYKGDGADNVGALSVSQDSETKRNFYLWTSTRPTLQDYDIFVRIALPEDFVRWKTGDGVHTLELDYRSTSSNAGDNALDISVYDTNGTAVSLSDTATGLASASWATASINFLASPVWTAGDEFLIKLHLSATNNSEMHLGSIKLRSTHLQGQ